jgi:phosphatidylglycerophosphate synthase
VPTFVREQPEIAAALVIDGSVLVEPNDLKRVIEADGRLTTSDGAALPVRMAAASAPVSALGVAHAVTDAASAREAERKLWRSLGSSADGVVDRFFNRPIGRVLSKVLIHTPVSPNQVSVASILIGVGSAPFFAAGDFVSGAVLLQVCAIVDCVDGDLARALFKQSPLGKWLDIGGDQVVHFSVFAAIGLGVARTSPTVPAIALGASAAVGVVLCFPVIIRALRRPASQRGWVLSKLLDSTANRDFSVLLLALALVGRMDLFLWMAGIGIHVFWIALLALDRRRAT